MKSTKVQTLGTIAIIATCILEHAWLLHVLYVTFRFNYVGEVTRKKAKNVGGGGSGALPSFYCDE